MAAAEDFGAAGAAPFHAGVAEGPASGHAVWVRTRDGLRLRVGLWPHPGARGTALIFPGRTEFVEKYGAVAAGLAARGLATAAVDWRGQGLADRQLSDPMTGHVMRFEDYQQDVAAYLGAVRAASLPAPMVLVAHSMGGAIGLRALHEGLPVVGACFSAPMWGLALKGAVMPAAWVLSWAAGRLGFGHRYAPGTGPDPYVGAAAMAGNVLTSDPQEFARMQRQLAAHPELALGGPSLGWLGAALLETRALRRQAMPALPCHVAVGTNERVVDPEAVAAGAARWSGASFARMEGAEHEILMERPGIRGAFLDRIAKMI
ncbi:alpha/beta hydrolase [Frigidibacter sp. MR17.14]|uniref:alpha/beta hydrolase n=1 Tax=Frigidibacter sp. MR17.14 TaxID=3126509 RepID=UPI003012A085